MIELLEGNELPQDIHYDRKRAAAHHAEIIKIGMEEMTERERDVLVRRKLVESPLTLEQRRGRGGQPIDGIMPTEVDRPDIDQRGATPADPTRQPAAPEGEPIQHGARNSVRWGKRGRGRE